MLSDQLGEILRRARRQLDMSREELARRAKVSTRLVAEVERGKRPNVSLESTLKLLNLVGVSIVATAPDGAVAEIRNARTIAMGRAARAKIRRRTWVGGHILLDNEGDAPKAGQSARERLAATSRISRSVAGLSKTSSRVVR